FKHEVERFEETFGSAALVSQFTSGLLPGAVDLPQDVVIRNESFLEHNFIEIVLTTHLIDRIDLDATALHVHQKLCETMTPVFSGRRRCAKQRDHVIGDMRIARPDLTPAYMPAFVDLYCLGFHRKQIRAGAWFTHADDEAQFAATDARQNICLD